MGVLISGKGRILSPWEGREKGGERNCAILDLPPRSFSPEISGSGFTSAQPGSAGLCFRALASPSPSPFSRFLPPSLSPSLLPPLQSGPSKMAPLDLDKYVEIARLCKYLPENDLKVRWAVLGPPRGRRSWAIPLLFCYSVSFLLCKPPGKRGGTRKF